MTPAILHSEPLYSDTSTLVFRTTDEKDGYTTGVGGLPFVMWINNQVQIVQQILDPAPRSASVGFVTAAERGRKLAKDSRRSAALQRARQRVGNWMASEQLEGSGLVALRLKAGLSQTELARRLDMQQPNLSRLEKGLVDPKLSTLQQLAEALGVDLGSVAAAVALQRQIDE